MTYRRLSDRSLTAPCFRPWGGACRPRTRSSVSSLAGASIPARCTRKPAGGMLNALRAARREGVAATLVSTRGRRRRPARAVAPRHRGGRDARDHSANLPRPVDTELTAILDETGDVVGGASGLWSFTTPPSSGNWAPGGIREIVAGCRPHPDPSANLGARRPRSRVFLDYGRRQAPCHAIRDFAGQWRAARPSPSPAGRCCS